MKNEMIKYLDFHLMITYKEFVKKSYKIYNKNIIKFKIEKHMLKNIYYNRSKDSLAFTKYSALENSNKNDDNYFLGDFPHITLYNSSGKPINI